MKVSLIVEDALAVIAFSVGIGLALFPVLSLAPKPKQVVAFRQLPERCVFPEKVEGCGNQQWIVQGCDPFAGPEITCVNATSRKARK